jgi:hypothetical protein
VVAELEAKEVSRGSMDSLRTDLSAEAARERRKKRHNGSRGWSKRCMNHRSGKKSLKRECRRKSEGKCK